MPQPADQTCGNCHFLDDTYENGIPRCHRYPPQVRVTLTTSNLWLFPEMDKQNWCGEWRPILTSGSISAYEEE